MFNSLKRVAGVILGLVTAQSFDLKAEIIASENLYNFNTKWIIFRSSSPWSVVTAQPQIKKEL